MPVDQSLGATNPTTPARPQIRAKRRTARASWLLLAVVAAGFSSSASAQQYRSDPVDEKAFLNKNTALSSAKGTNNYATEKPKVEEYFKKHFFPDITRYEPADLAKLGDKRLDLFRRYLWATSNATMQSDLTALALNAMKQIVVANNPPYHPAVRYNAVLIIGMLDEQYAIEAGANRRPPKPLPEANVFLVQIVNLGAAGKAVPPPLLAGALIGLERHAQYHDGLSREAIEAMTAAALKIAAQDKPILEMDSQVHAWMRLKAASVLAQLGSVGTNNQIHDTLIKMIADSKSLDDRSATAALLAQVKYDGAKVDGPAAAEKMLKLARDVAEAEAKRAEEFRDRRFTGGGGGFAGGERGGGFRGRFDEGGGGYVGEEQDDYPRRHVLARLSDLKTGLTALKPVVPADAQTKFDTIIAAVNPAIDATANKDTVGLNVASAVVTMANAIRSVTGGAAPAAVAAEEAAFEAPVDAPAEAPAGGAPVDAAPAAAVPAKAE